MSIWPFGRKSRQNSRSKLERSDVSVGASRPGNTPAESATKPVLIPHQTPTRKQSRKIGQRRRRASTRGSEARWIDEKDPRMFSEKPPLPPSSAEDITALPYSKELGTSPHLRPATTPGRADIPYNFHSQSHSQSHIHPAERTVKPQGPATSRSKRSAYDSNSQQRRSSKKRKEDDHVREEEIRAMSAPISIPTRPATMSGPPTARDGRKMRSGLSNKPSRMSDLSLPTEESVHSSMSGVIEQRAFEISGMDMFSPRPTIRYSGVPQQRPQTAPSSGIGVSRSGSRKDRPPMAPVKPPATPETRKEPSKKDRTIDDLADDLDAGALRELMERDQRRREKKKKEQTDRLQRKLQRKADKQRREEEKKELASIAAARAEQEAGKALIEEPRGLGTKPEQVAPSKKPLHIDTTQGEGAVNTGTYLDYPPRGDIPSNPFADRSPTSGSPAIETSTPVETHAEAPTEAPAETTYEEPVLNTAQAVRLSKASMSPPTSPVGHARVPSSLSQLTDLRQTRTAEAPEPAQTERRTSEASSRRPSAWTSFFRRGGATMKQGSEDSGRASPSEFSFSNTSRESMSRQQLPVHLQQSAARARSGTPIRTQSKFREDLPGLPMSPPDSRVQSPEVSLPASHAIAIRRGHEYPQRLAVGTTSPATPNPFQDHVTNGRTDSPVSPDGRESVAIMSQSLASVDSEGSWLSGKPVKRHSNQSQLRSSSGSPGKRPDFNASYEELGMPDDVHSHGLTLDRGTRSVTAAAKSSNRKASDISAITPITPDTESDDEHLVHSEPSPDQTVVREGLQRQPTVISRDARIISGDGLAAEYMLGGDYETPPDGTPNDESPFYEEQRARASSVEYGQLAHARHVSVGSAKLLDIPASKSNRHSMGSTYTPSASPGFKSNSSPYFVTELPVDESTQATR